MNPNQTKDQDRGTFGKNTQSNPRDKRGDKATTRQPGENEMNEPVGTPETNQPRDDRKGNPAGQNPQPRRETPEYENPLDEREFETDSLKSGR